MRRPPISIAHLCQHALFAWPQEDRDQLGRYCFVDVELQEAAVFVM
jgi:hypothetical protein